MTLTDDTGQMLLRVAVFVGVFAILAIFERLRPRRVLSLPRARRWVTNLSIVGIDSLIVRAMALLAVPLAAVAAAIFAESHSAGLFNWVALPAWLETLLAILALDLAIWAQHVASHKIPLFWRLHQMHHADVDIDVTTALRFHPVEIALSMIWKIICVIALGASPLAVILFEVLLNASAMFSHANIALSSPIDRGLRTVIVTPDMHRVHHSVLLREHDSNFGFNLSIWDRLFGTYTAQPKNGHEGMTIGLASYQTAAPAGLLWSLILPLRPLLPEKAESRSIVEERSQFRPGSE